MSRKLFSDFPTLDKRIKQGEGSLSQTLGSYRTIFSIRAFAASQNENRNPELGLKLGSGFFNHRIHWFTFFRTRHTHYMPPNFIGTYSFIFLYHFQNFGGQHSAPSYLDN